mmetsp:Transcript_1327/g.2636  ORF Transcript_1327/g.2636 Transcript_1327/m.2636 type:complete len:174 (+) Transcript_1327:1219-1740(+)|eukprot:scaffold790_cov119-Amphora_coffeaeformis.AAC.3
MSTSPRYRNIVPRHSAVSRNNSFTATDIFEIGAEAQTIEALRNAVEDRLANDNERYASVLQMVVIPLYSEFPSYDFFLFHRHRGLLGWKKCSISAGYQCKMGTKYPDKEHKAARDVKKSIWIERRAPDVRRGSSKSHGWTLLFRKEHRRLLGESLYAALPVDIEDEVCEYCNA